MWERVESKDLNRRYYAYQLFPLKHIKLHVWKESGGAWSWVLRDLRLSRNIFMQKDVGKDTSDRKLAQQRAMVAFIMYIAIKLINNTDDSRELDGYT